MFVGVFVFAWFVFEVEFLFVIEVDFLLSFITPQDFVLCFRVGRLDLFTSCLGDHFDAFFRFIRLGFPLRVLGFGSLFHWGYRFLRIWLI